ncbi:MAG: polyprenyl synthetase family protein [Sulfolobales archaeon]
MSATQSEGDFEAFAKTYISLVERNIYSVLSGDPEILYKASSHLIKAGGKRLRPLVLGLVGVAYGVKPEVSAIAGASIEILHNFTLVHDDIMDRDEFRRGVPTTHRVYGENMAILAGDLLFAKSYEAMTRLYDLGVESEKVLKAIKTLTWASITVAEGQAMDLELASASYVSEDKYIEMIYKKTSALFMASAYIGGILGGALEEDLERLWNCFKSAGIAFQIRDDLIGLLGDPSVTGKPVLSDLREGKKTIMVIYALSKLGRDEREYLLGVLGNRNASREDLERARDLIVGVGGVKYAEELIRRYVDDALRNLEMLRGAERRPISWIRDLILRLAWRER